MEPLGSLSKDNITNHERLKARTYLDFIDNKEKLDEDDDEDYFIRINNLRHYLNLALNKIDSMEKRLWGNE